MCCWHMCCASSLYSHMYIYLCTPTYVKDLRHATPPPSAGGVAHGTSSSAENSFFGAELFVSLFFSRQRGGEETTTGEKCMLWLLGCLWLLACPTRETTRGGCAPDTITPDPILHHLLRTVISASLRSIPYTSSLSHNSFTLIHSRSSCQRRLT
jgi:hypothetical protein